MKINLLINNKESWFWEYAYSFEKELEEKGYKVTIVTNNEDLTIGGDICFFLACTNIVPEKYLEFHDHNIVIHHSDLPKGRGSSPIVWQILEGKNEIPFTMFEADKNVDAGLIYMQKFLTLDGSELLNEIFYKRWQLEKKMIFEFLENYTNIDGKEQTGETSFYRRRNAKDDELPINETLETLFNRFRVVDNEKWPLYFYKNGHKYYLKIYKEKKDD